MRSEIQTPNKKSSKMTDVPLNKQYTFKKTKTPHHNKGLAPKLIETVLTITLKPMLYNIKCINYVLK